MLDLISGCFLVLSELLEISPIFLIEILAVISLVCLASLRKDRVKLSWCNREHRVNFIENSMRLDAKVQLYRSKFLLFLFLLSLSVALWTLVNWAIGPALLHQALFTFWSLTTIVVVFGFTRARAYEGRTEAFRLTLIMVLGWFNLVCVLVI